MLLHPITRPRIGLHVGARTLSLVEAHRQWGGTRALRMRRCGVRELPAGLVRLSATEPNVADVATLAGEVQALLGDRRAAAVSLTVPDQCARLALFEFESFPQKPSECEALVRWRFQKDLNLPVADARLAFHVFQSTPARASRANRADLVGARVLAVAIRQEVLDQYEQACEQAGLLPLSVGIASLRLFDLCRPAMVELMSTNGSSITRDEFFFVSLNESKFSFLAFRRDCPVFLRVKALRNGGDSAFFPEGLVADELLATLQYYDDAIPLRAESMAQRRPLFLTGEVGSSMMDSGAAEALRVQVFPIGLEFFPFSGSNLPCQLPRSGLAAVAGLLES